MENKFLAFVSKVKTWISSNPSLSLFLAGLVAGLFIGIILF